MVQAAKKVIGKDGRSQMVDELRKRFESVESGILADFRGLSVEKFSALRSRLREQGVSVKVVKNSLACLAVEGTVYQDLKGLLVGPTAVAFSGSDPIAPARIAAEFSKETDKFDVKGGFMEGRVLSREQVLEVSKLPGRKELLAQLLSAFNGPSQKFLGVLNGVPQKFLGVLKAQADKLAEA